MTDLTAHSKKLTKHGWKVVFLTILVASNAEIVQAQQSLHSQRDQISQQQQRPHQAQQVNHPRSELSSLSSSCSNYISINGETNINQFSLNQNVPEDLICGMGDSRWIRLPEEQVYLIRVPVRNFQASNRMVYKDFLDLVDVVQHPYINIFIEEEQFQLLFQDHRSLVPRIGISVAGTTRYYEVHCQVNDCLDGKIAVSGQKTLKLTDFKLAPPEKTLGLIKVQNKLIINFELILPSEPGIKLTKI